MNIIYKNRWEIFFCVLRNVESKGEMVSTSDSALNGARSCTRVGPMGHESHAGSRTTHAPALTPDLTLSTECRFIIGHKLRRKNLEGNSIRCQLSVSRFIGRSRLLARSSVPPRSLLESSLETSQPILFPILSNNSERMEKFITR